MGTKFLGVYQECIHDVQFQVGGNSERNIASGFRSLSSKLISLQDNPVQVGVSWIVRR